MFISKLYLDIFIKVSRESVQIHENLEKEFSLFSDQKEFISLLGDEGPFIYVRHQQLTKYKLGLKPIKIGPD